jgi:hypothetical protein
MEVKRISEHGREVGSRRPENADPSGAGNRSGERFLLAPRQHTT